MFNRAKSTDNKAVAVVLAVRVPLNGSTSLHDEVGRSDVLRFVASEDDGVALSGPPKDEAVAFTVCDIKKGSYHLEIVVGLDLAVLVCRVLSNSVGHALFLGSEQMTVLVGIVW